MQELPRTQLRLLVVYSGMAVGVDTETVAVHIIYVQKVCEEYPPVEWPLSVHMHHVPPG